MKVDKLTINKVRARQLLNSEEAQRLVLDRAKRVKAKADSYGSGTYVADVQPGRNRAHALVKTPPGDFRTMASNAKHNSLVRAMGEVMGP